MNYKEKQIFFKILIWMIGFIMGTAFALSYTLLN